MIYCLLSYLCYFPQNNLFAGTSTGPPKLSEDNNDRMRAGLLSKVNELLIIYYIHVHVHVTQNSLIIQFDLLNCPYLFSFR